MFALHIMHTLSDLDIMTLSEVGLKGISHYLIFVAYDKHLLKNFLNNEVVIILHVLIDLDLSK
jgi:hypothetical protein